VTDRQKALEEAMAQLTKNFGEGSVMRLDSNPQPIEVIPTGSLALDAALGVGGYPKGRIVEIFGPESSGKSTLALHAVANCQKAGGNVLYVDSEYSIDPVYGKALGVNLSDLIVSQPSTFEEAMEIVLGMVRSGGVDLVVIDSIAALSPRAELSGDVGDATVGLVARLMSQTMRKITAPLAEHNTTLICINQLRDMINSMGFGPRETTSGGRALRFHSSLRLDVRRIATEKTGDDATGNRTKVKVVKNKCAPPLKTAEFSIEYGEGISREAEILDMAVDFGLLVKKGAWFSYESQNVAQGRVKAIEWLRESPEVADTLEVAIRERL
jgi:recombination protein RecA